MDCQCIYGGRIQLFEDRATAVSFGIGNGKMPSEYIKEGFDWAFKQMEVGRDARDKALPDWMQPMNQTLDWFQDFNVSLVEGAINGVVGLGEVVYQVAQDPVGMGEAIGDMASSAWDSTSEGVSDAYHWASESENWSNAVDDAWDWASEADNWEQLAEDTGKGIQDAGNWVVDNPRKIGNTIGEFIPDAIAAAYTAGGSVAATAGKTAVKEVGEEVVEKMVKEAVEETAEKVAKETLEEAGETAGKKAAKETAEEIAKKAAKKPPGKVVTKMLQDVPGIAKFSKWFDELTSSQFDEIWKNPSLRKKIEARIRYPGGLHEWLMCSRANVFKKWGVSMDEIKKMRTKIDDVIFKNPPGKHGGPGSTKAHNEILDIIDNSNSYDNFKDELIKWADNRLEGGSGSLPSGFFY